MAGKLYTCGGYGGDCASLLCINADGWGNSRVPTSGPAPKSHDSHSMVLHGAGPNFPRQPEMYRGWGRANIDFGAYSFLQTGRVLCTADCWQRWGTVTTQHCKRSS